MGSSALRPGSHMVPRPIQDHRSPWPSRHARASRAPRASCGPPTSAPSQRQVEVNVRNKILSLIQAWAHAFRNEPKYKVVQDTYQIMKVEGEWAGRARDAHHVTKWGVACVGCQVGPAHQVLEWEEPKKLPVPACWEAEQGTS